MIKKDYKVILLPALLAVLICPSGNAIEKNYSNNLLKVDLNKSGSNDVKLTLYTSKSYKMNLHPIKKANNEYVVILPETYHSITSNPSVRNVNGMVKNVDIKLVPYLGGNQNNGYTKLTIKAASDNVNFRVENRSVAKSHNILNDTMGELSRITAGHSATKKVKTAPVAKTKVVKSFTSAAKTNVAQKAKPKTIQMSLFKAPANVQVAKAILPKVQPKPQQKTQAKVQIKQAENKAKTVAVQTKTASITAKTQPAQTNIVKKTQSAPLIAVLPAQKPAKAPVKQQEKTVKTQTNTAVASVAKAPQKSAPQKPQGKSAQPNFVAEILIGLLMFIGFKIFSKLKNAKKNFDFADVYEDAEAPIKETKVVTPVIDTANLLEDAITEKYEFENTSWQEIYRASQSEQLAKIEENRKKQELAKQQHLEMLFEEKQATTFNIEAAEAPTIKENYPVNEAYLKEEFLIEENVEEVAPIPAPIAQNPLPPAETILAQEVEPQNLFNEKYITRESTEPNVLDVRNIAENKGFYLIDFDDEKSLFGFINDNVYLINKFSKDLKQTKIYTKKTETKKEKDIYLVQLEDWRALVSVGSDKIETMLEL